MSRSMTKTKSMSKTKTKSKAKAAAAKPSASRGKKAVAVPKPAKATAAKTSSRPETPRTRAPTVSAETPRTRAPTISTRSETPRTRAPTAAPRARGRETLTWTRAESMPRPRGRETIPWKPSTAPRADRDTITEPPFEDAQREAAMLLRDPSAELADPGRAAELAELAERAETEISPEVLVALATQIDKLGMQLAYEISRNAHDEAHIAPLKPVLIRVPALYGKTLLRAAEKFDDQGSPRRAAYVLFEALRKAFDHDVITSVADALSFVLEAHGQTGPATRIRTLLVERDAQRASGVERREVRTKFSAALEELREGVDWNALEDVPELFD